MEQQEIRDFRQRVWMELIERLVLKTALLAPVLAAGLSIDQSRQLLVDWLKQNAANADLAYGAHFRDPAMVALYADEVNTITNKMIQFLESLNPDNR